MNLPEILEQIAQSQLRTQNIVGQLAEAQVRTEKSITDLAATVEQYVDGASAYVQAANARMAQMEKNLDNLIRIITAEHSNGKDRH